MQPGPSGRKVRTDRYGHGKRWKARWVEGGRERSKTFATKDAAETHLARVEVGTPVRRGQGVLVRDYVETWRLSQLHHREGTKVWAKRAAGRIVTSLGDLALSDVTRQDVQAMLGEWTAKRAPSTVQVTYAAMTAMMRMAVADGLIESSPCVSIRLPARPKDKIVPLTEQQVMRIRSEMPEWLRAMVTLAVSSGMRGGEMRGLTVDRISGTTVRVDRQMISQSGPPRWGPPKSVAGVRTIDIGQAAMDELLQHIERFPPGPQGLIFLTRHKTPVTRSVMSDNWREATTGMHLRPRSGWHDLRHYHASMLIAASLSPRAVADRLGHEDPAETLRTYSHLWGTDEARAVAAVDAMMGRISGPSGAVTASAEPDSPGEAGPSRAVQS